MDELIYLDAAASTALAPEVLEAMLPALGGAMGNPGSAHWAGRNSLTKVDTGRQHLADLMGVGPTSVIFTSGATESNNLALCGLLDRDSTRRELVTCTTEHASILQTMVAMRAKGFLVHVVPVDGDGQVRLDALRAVVGDRTALVSIHAANNETGVVQDLAAVGEVVHEAGAFLHSDASQLMVWGRSAIADECDLVTVSSHKMHGPQGIGALIVSRNVRRDISPLIQGGGQEAGLRSGTLNVAGIVGFGAATALSARSGSVAAVSTTRLRESLAAGLQERLAALDNAASASSRLPGLLNVSLADDAAELDANAVMAQMPRLAASSGSACRAGAPEPSPVLLAMGFAEKRAMASLRLSLSRFTTPADVSAALPIIAEAVRRVREASCSPAAPYLDEVSNV